jgi:cytochrome c biogenesis protein CcmG, thiol:disulfide interchange protein DsbE
VYLSAKYGFAMIIVIGAISICSPSARMRLHQASTLQAAQAERDAVPYFKLENVAGGFMTSEDLKGKVTVVDLWATWCKPCVDEIPIYNRLYDAFESRGVAIVGIAVYSPPRDIPSKVRQLGIKYPVLIGDDKAIHAFGRVQAFPTTVVISKEGKIYKRYIGGVPDKEQKIKQDIEYLFGGKLPGASAKNHFMHGLIFFQPRFMMLTDEPGSLP